MTVKGKLHGAIHFDTNTGAWENADLFHRDDVERAQNSYS